MKVQWQVTVSRDVNSVKNDTEQCIRPIEEGAGENDG
jgi:hypothetical protein